MKNYIILLLIVFFLLIIFSYLIKKYTNTEGFLDTKYKKTICLVWRNKINNDTHHGLGDKIRGAIRLYQHCKENKLNLTIDATNDICGDFLKNVTLTNNNITKDTPLFIIDTDFMITNYGKENNQLIFDKLIKEKLSTNDTIYLYSNSYPKNKNYDIDDLEFSKNLEFATYDIDDLEFAKYICEPIDELKIEINNVRKTLPDKYGIKHFRFNDKVFTNDVDSNDKLFKKYFELLKNNYKSTDVLLTNSYNFKKYAVDQLGIQTIKCNDAECKPNHIGHNTDKESNKNTFIEFFIINNSSYIETYSCYFWPSNFVYWPSKIYNIPFEMKKNL